MAPRKLAPPAARETERWLREDAPQLIPPADAAFHLNRHSDTVRIWCRTGDLPCVSIGTNYLIRRGDLADVLGIELA